MNIIPIYNLESIYSPKLDYLIITFIIIVIAQVVEKNLSIGERQRIASKQRETYYTKLKEEAAKMDEKASIKEQELSDEIEQLQNEGENLRSQLNDSDISDADEDSDENITTSEASFNDKIDRQKHELSQLQESVKELEIVEESINHLTMDSSEINAKLDDQALEYRISQLEAENKQLKFAIEDFKANQMKSSLLISNTKLDPDILNYIEAHKEDLTLEFLKTAQETLLELKALHPDMDFNDYIKNLKNSQIDYDSALNELRVKQKEFEIKYQLYKKKYEEELTSFDELRLENLLKNHGAKEHLAALRESNKLKMETFTELKNQLSQKQSEINKWQNKYQEADEQCQVYWKACKETSMKLEQLEIENKASRERDRRLMNMSSPSSMLNQVIPPPPEPGSYNEPIDHSRILQSLEPSGPFSLDRSISPPPEPGPFNASSLNV